MMSINVSKLLLCIGYMIVGPSLIMLNKYILYDLHFPYPMFLSGLGVLFSGLFAQLLVLLGYVKLQRKEAVEGILWYKRVLPIGLAYAGTLALGNFVYLLLNVGFIQMLKSFVPVIVMIVAYIAAVETPTKPIILSVLVISIGISFTVSYTPDVSALGLMIILIAETFEAIRLVLTQYLLQNLKFSVIESQYILSPASAFWLFLASFCFEFELMKINHAFMVIFKNPHVFLLASCLGLLINYLTYYVIQATSSLTLKILGGVRNILTISISVLEYHEVITVREASGYFVALIGFGLYSCIKAGYFDSTALLSILISTASSSSSSSSSSSPIKRLTELPSTMLLSNYNGAAMNNDSHNHLIKKYNNSNNNNSNGRNVPSTSFDSRTTDGISTVYSSDDYDIEFTGNTSFPSSSSSMNTTPTLITACNNDDVNKSCNTINDMNSSLPSSSSPSSSPATINYHHINNDSINSKTASSSPATAPDPVISFHWFSSLLNFRDSEAAIATLKKS